VALTLAENEARILGCLIEKSVVTPNLYPLTLNSLTAACNQKSGRNPVMSLKPGEVQHVARALVEKRLVRIDENFKSKAEKYLQRFCNTRYSDFQFEPAQLAIVCLLLLRGPQTPGELRAHSGRLHEFTDNTAVTDAISDLIERERGPLLVKLPRIPGRKDSEVMHLFSGPVDIAAHVAQARAENKTGRADTSQLEQRISQLEADVASLKAIVESLPASDTNN